MNNQTNSSSVEEDRVQKIKHLRPNWKDNNVIDMRLLRHALVLDCIAQILCACTEIAWEWGEFKQALHKYKKV